MPSKRNASTGRAKKKTQARKDNLSLNRYTDERAEQERARFLSTDAQNDIMGVIIAIIGIGLALAFLNPSSGILTQTLRTVLQYGFGIGAYVIPPAFIGWSVIVFIRPSKTAPLKGAVSLLCIVIALMSIMAVYTPVPADYSESGFNYLFSSTDMQARGGLVGSAIAFALLALTDKTIATLILAGLILIGLIIIGVSISDLVDFFVARLSKPEAAYDSVADEYEDGLYPAEKKVSAGTVEPFFQKLLFWKKDSLLDEWEYDSDEEYDDRVYVDEDATKRLESSAYSRIKTRLNPSGRSDTPASGTVEWEDEINELKTGFAHQNLPSCSLNPQDKLPVENLDVRRDQHAKTALLPRKKPAAPATADKRQSAQAQAQVRHKSNSQGVISAGKKNRQAYPTPTEGFELPREDSLIMHSAQFKLSPEQERELNATQERLQDTLQTFGMSAQVVGWTAGPTVTTFRVAMGEGERLSKLLGLEDDIALALAASSVRIFSPIPHTSLVGVEIPNYKRSQVTLGDVMPFVKGGPLTLAIGRDVEGNPVTSDLAKMPHLLIAGTTGSGKSVMINTILSCLLMRATPHELRLIMVDPKRVELSGYNDIPQLYVPVVTDPRQAASSLQWAVAEMERRLKIFEKAGARNIGIFNGMIQDGKFDEHESCPEEMPYMVIVIDELTDLMMVAGKDVEASIVRIAQLGRAAGIHLIVATQRPAAEVVTNAIKVNIVNRIAFKVATSVDSRVILGQGGAEKLIGLGDMLYDDGKSGKPTRLQGCFVSDEEIESIVAQLREQGEPDYHEEILSVVLPSASPSSASSGGSTSDDDPLIWEAAEAVIQMKMGSTSGIQRRLKVGYARAGRIMDMLEEKGVVGPADGTKPREVLVSLEELETLRAFELQDNADKDGEF